MARFTEEQLEEAKKIIRPFVDKAHCESFNAKIPLSVLDKSDKFHQVAVFHANLIKLCHNLFDGFHFTKPCKRRYVTYSYKPALFVVWLQEEMPEIVKYCLDSFDDDRFELHVVTEYNVSEYIDIPNYIYKAYQENKICPADYSDYIRIKLLETYIGIYFDATTLIVNKIPDYVINDAYWSVKGDYQKNTSPIAMLHFNFGQVYAMGGYDNLIYSYARQLLDFYYSQHSYCFSYYMIYYILEYLYSIDSKIRLYIDNVKNNNEDCEQLAYILDDIGSGKLDAKDFKYRDTFFYKLRSSDNYNLNHYRFFNNL